MPTKQKKMIHPISFKRNASFNQKRPVHTHRPQHCPAAGPKQATVTDPCTGTRYRNHVSLTQPNTQSRETEGAFLSP